MSIGETRGATREAAMTSSRFATELQRRGARERSGPLTKGGHRPTVGLELQA